MNMTVEELTEQLISDCESLMAIAAIPIFDPAEPARAGEVAFKIGVHIDRNAVKAAEIRAELLGIITTAEQLGVYETTAPVIEQRLSELRAQETASYGWWKP